jgi:hypothetical protein
MYSLLVAELLLPGLDMLLGITPSCSSNKEALLHKRAASPNDSSALNAENALSQLFYIFHTVVNAYILHFTKLTEKGIVDEQLQSKGLLLIITRLANMQKAVRQALNSFHGGRLNSLFYDNIYDEKMIQDHANIFKDAGITEEVEPLLQSVAQIYRKVELGT